MARTISLAGGLFLFALGIVLMLESELGLSPWDVLNQGIADQAGLSFGTANIVVALVVLVVAWLLGAQDRAGTVANAICIGLFVDGLLAVDAFDALAEAPLAVRIAAMVAGDRSMIGVGSGFYIGAGARRRAARLADARARASQPLARRCRPGRSRGGRA